MTSPKKYNYVCFPFSGHIDSKDKEGAEAEEKKAKVSEKGKPKVTSAC